MCWWVQHHYGACRHQHTFLDEFCRNSRALTSSAPHSKKEPDETAVPDSLWTPDPGERPPGGNDAPGQEGPCPLTGASTSTSHPPPSSSKRSTRHHHRLVPSSTFSDYSFTPIPEETAEDIASLEQQHQQDQKPTSPRRFSEPATKDMAGLAPFGKSTFRHLMGGGGSPQLATPVTTTKHHNDREELKPDLNQQRGSLRIRQPGIRDQSDESYHLPDSNEILHHSSHNCRGDFSSSHIGTDMHRESSFGSDAQHLAGGGTARQQQESIDAIESDLNILQTEIATLRAEEKQPLQMEQFPALPAFGSRLPVPKPEPKQEESPSQSKVNNFKARIREQEKAKQARLAKEKMERENVSPERPPGIEQFPGLGTTPSSTTSGRTITSSGGQSTRKVSYASAATLGMKAAVDKAGTGNRQSIGVPSTVSASGTPRGSIGSFNSPQQITTGSGPGNASQVAPSEAGDSSVIISPQGAQSGTRCSGASATSTSTKTVGKQSPRFAQPTKATARRADETLRKDSMVPKGSPEGSPTRSTRTLAQSPPKRAPIPVNWTTGSDSSPSKQSFHTAVGSIHSSSPSRSRDPPSSPERKAVSSTHSKNSSPEQGLRKKTSSYMSPTKATTQRHIETLGQETIKQSPPRMSKAIAKIDTNMSPTRVVMSPLENTPPLSVPWSGSTLRSRSPVEFEQYNITERVMQQLASGGPPAMADASSATPEEFAPRAVSSSTASVFSSPIEPSASEPNGRMSRRYTVGSPVVEMLAAKAREAGFPEVANTIVKRRGSHGHLLTPIVKRLGKECLLRSPEALPQVPEHAPEATMPMMAKQNIPVMPIPRHQAPQIIAPAHMPPHMLREMSFQAATQGTSFNAGAPATAQARQQNPRTGSLRATAMEFKPMSQSQTTQKKTGSAAMTISLDYRSQEEWDSLDQGVRDTVRTLRHEKEAEGWKPTRPSQFRRPHDPAPVAYSSSMGGPQLEPGASGGNPIPVQDPASTQHSGREPEPLRMFEPWKTNPIFFITKPFHQPHVVEAGVVLKLEINQATNSIQWFKEAADGSKEMIHFGRATAPDNETPTISPSSNDTSPPKPFTPSPDSARRWRIGSLMDNKYGWKGGDGLEISFRGSGANAERDPNPPSDVDFGGNLGIRSSNFNNGARFIGGGRDDGPGSPPLAPRSREQWAKLMGFDRVPCGTLRFEAREEIPLPPLWEDSKFGPFGFCEPCYPRNWP